MIISTPVLHISELRQLRVPEILLHNEAGDKWTVSLYQVPRSSSSFILMLPSPLVPQKCGGQTAVQGECFFAASSTKCSAASYHPDKSLPFPQMYRDLPHLLCVPVLPSTWRDFSHFSPSLIHLVSWKNPTLPLGLTSYVGVPCAYPLDSSGQSQLLFSYRTLTAISC